MLRAWDKTGKWNDKEFFSMILAPYNRLILHSSKDYWGLTCEERFMTTKKSFHVYWRTLFKHTASAMAMPMQARVETVCSHYQLIESNHFQHFLNWTFHTQLQTSDNRRKEHFVSVQTETAWLTTKWTETKHQLYVGFSVIEELDGEQRVLGR